jgi:hypothetical protein
MKTNTMPAATGTQNGNTGDISMLNRADSLCVVECLYLLFICDEPRRPDGAPPRRIDVCRYICKTPHCLAVPRRGLEAGDPPELAWFNDFMVWVRTLCSCLFLQSRFFHA